MPRSPRLVEMAPAKVNLTLRVLGRRSDGYHTLESLVVFARVTDRLTFVPGGPLALTVAGPTAKAAGARNNLVVKAAREFASVVPKTKFGRFSLTKELPVAAGLGGGSADAAAALRLLARANGVRRNDPRLRRAARKIGADVSVCIDARPRIMRGIGERLSAPLKLPALPAVLVNPGARVRTPHVFAAWSRMNAGSSRPGKLQVPRGREALLEFLRTHPNDLEAAAIRIEPAIARALAALRASPGCRLARMSGSGATCFGLFASSRAATAAARKLAAARSTWWVRATVLG